MKLFLRSCGAVATLLALCALAFVQERVTIPPQKQAVEEQTDHILRRLGLKTLSQSQSELDRHAADERAIAFAKANSSHWKPTSQNWLRLPDGSYKILEEFQMAKGDSEPSALTYAVEQRLRTLLQSYPRKSSSANRKVSVFAISYGTAFFNNFVTYERHSSTLTVAYNSNGASLGHGRSYVGVDEQSLQSLHFLLLPSTRNDAVRASSGRIKEESW